MKKRPNSAVAGKVAAIANGQITVHLPRREACRQCLEGRGCGLGLLRTTTTSPVAIVLPFEPRAATELAVGQTVCVEPYGGNLLQLTLVGYGLPLTGLLLGAALGEGFAEDAGALIIGVALALVGWLSGKALLAQRRFGFRLTLTDNHD